MKINLMYLGKKGGGALLTRNLIEELQKSNADFGALLSDRSEVYKAQLESHSLIWLKNPHSLRDLFSYPKFFLGDIIKILSFASSIRKQTLIVTMISPFDLFAILVFKTFGVRICTIIHDFSTHNGENWPSNRSVKRRIILSDVCIFLSHSESRKAVTIEHKKKEVLFHPILQLDSSPNYEVDTGLNHIPTFLFIGRIRKYKGLEILIDAWKEDIPAKLIIAGEGPIKNKTLGDNVFLVNRWLTENEIYVLLKDSDFIVFPYTEASQSGLLPIALSMGKSLILSDLPSFREQVGDDDRSVEWVPVGEIVALESIFRKIIAKRTNYPVSQGGREVDYSMSRFLAELTTLIENFNWSNKHEAT